MSSNKQYDKISKWIEMLQRTDLESPQGIQLSMLISDRIAWAIKFKICVARTPRTFRFVE